MRVETIEAATLLGGRLLPSRAGSRLIGSGADFESAGLVRTACSSPSRAAPRRRCARRRDCRWRRGRECGHRLAADSRGRSGETDGGQDELDVPSSTARERHPSSGTAGPTIWSQRRRPSGRAASTDAQAVFGDDGAQSHAPRRRRTIGRPAIQPRCGPAEHREADATHQSSEYASDRMTVAAKCAMRGGCRNCAWQLDRCSVLRHIALSHPARGIPHVGCTVVQV